MKTKILFLFLLVILFIFPFDFNKMVINQYQTNEIMVEVKGEIENPGVFVLEGYSTINDLLNQVILKENADLSTINLTTTLKNNDVIVIGLKQEKVSINSANLNQLISLPGIGETIALRIIEYRLTNGPFQKLEDIKKVKGIGDKKYENIRELICL